MMSHIEYLQIIKAIILKIMYMAKWKHFNMKFDYDKITTNINTIITMNVNTQNRTRRE